MGRRRVIKISNLVLIALAALLAGLAAARFGQTHSTLILTCLVLLAPLTLLRRALAIFIIVVLFWQIGLWRGGQVWQQIVTYENLIGQEVIVEGRVIDDVVYSDRGQNEFHIGEVDLVDKAGQSYSLVGRLRVRAFAASDIRRGDQIIVAGKLYQGFGNRQGSLSYAEIEVVSRSTSFIEKIRANFFTGIYSSLPEPQASLGLGFVVGLRTLLPEQLLSDLSATGLTHIVAVSGYNLTILVRIMRGLFARRSKYLATTTSATLIIGFIAITGAAPSVMRAAVVAGFALAGWYFGRRMRPSMMILLGAAVTAYASPLYLWYDIGWYLSFLAFIGVLVVGPLLEKRFFKRQLGFLGGIALETFSAQLMALPLIAVIFGELSVISLIANVIIVPLIPIAMALTTIAGLAGMLVPFLSGWLAWPAQILLTYMTEMIEWLANFPGALVDLRITWQLFGLFYAWVAIVLLIMKRKNKLDLNAIEVIER